MLQFGAYDEDVMSKVVKAIEIRIIDVKGSSITGQTLERYGYLKKHKPNDLKKIVTKKIIQKGKEIDFFDDELVAVHRVYKSNNLLTEDEMKLKMIDYIMHDFQTEDERDFHFEE
jgi:hypothetical protein